MSISKFATVEDHLVASSAKHKPVVKYRSAISPITVGYRAVVIPIDHPDVFLVSNGEPTTTSTVISVDQETGNFETKNTKYVLVDE